MVFFALTLLAFAAAFERGSTIGVAASGVLWGLALGTKANALFLPADRPRHRPGRDPAAGVARALGGAVDGAGVVRRRRAGHRVRAVAVSVGGADRARARAPPATSACASSRRGPRASSRRWPRSSTPRPCRSSVSPSPASRSRRASVASRPARGAVRPAAGVDHRGAGATAPARRRQLRRRAPLPRALPGARDPRRRRGSDSRPGCAAPPRERRAPRAAPPRAALVALLLAARASPRSLRVHPFELAYWNALAGGLGGARAKRLAQAGDYWVTSYRTGLDWLNAHAPPRHGARRAAGAAHGRDRGAGEAAPRHRAARSAAPDLAAAASRNVRHPHAARRRRCRSTSCSRCATTGPTT